ncbi:hypothetical protein HS1genome_1573 [Sulfodiicoccus acidiphilus]|uniref:Rieske domain-containing protein n=1 Tax=Sulfodiicoccus acidiphilus TaxID=1670455 RepID=A0A348B4T2_9CREN|nr:Rieske 2Fe-2S domain-containing protein [Sulfodiicoccus acidiphilus]BBD73184.1 hypothetical protein HS1genome_1573 [Sulfodiicoccus acidiphilus]GGU01364.1 hypothetical protein GCM10007116_18180 [Sulfodiicoccus acidiphilus]
MRTCLNLTEIPEGDPVKVHAGDQLVVLVRIGRKVWAISPYCPHKGADIWKGDVINEKIRCYLHGYIYDLNTGRPVFVPYPEKYGKWRETGNLVEFPVSEEGEQVCVTISGPSQ